MCELLGISVAPAARMAVLLKAFRHRAVANESGWGVAWYEDGVARVVKEATRADRSAKAEALAASPPRSSTFIVHVRAATVGRVAIENTHPFTATVLGRHWTFAHNGTIKGTDELPRGTYEPQGDTDSEAAFAFLVHELEALGVDPDAATVEATVARTARALSARGKANFLATDGRTLFGYYDGHKTLHYMCRSASDLRSVRVADDADYRIELDVEDAPEERAVILASVPLTDDAWTPLAPGSLVVCRDGRADVRPLTDCASA